MIQFDSVDLCLNWFLKQVKMTISYSYWQLAFIAY